MQRHPIISFLGGFIICGLILAVVCVFILLITFNLAGGETLQQVENQRTGLLIFTLFLGAFAGFVVLRMLKRKKKFTAYGISILPALAVVIVIVMFIMNLHVHTPFDKHAWDKSAWKPFSISATLVKENKLIGLSWQQVRDMLGKGSAEYGDKDTERGSVRYLVEDGWTLTVYFEKDKVVDTKLRLPFLGV